MQRKKGEESISGVKTKKAYVTSGISNRSDKKLAE